MTQEITVNDGELGQIKLAERKETSETGQSQSVKKPKSKKGPDAARYKREQGNTQCPLSKYNFINLAAAAAAKGDGNESEEEISEVTELVATPTVNDDSSDQDSDEEQEWKKLQKRGQSPFYI